MEVHCLLFYSRIFYSRRWQ